MQTIAEEQEQEMKILKLRYNEKCNQMEKDQVNWWDKWHQSFEMFQEQMKMDIKEIIQEKADMTKFIDEMKILQTEVTRIRDIQNCGEFLWCIDNWEDKLERGRNGIDKFINSNPFYSHRNGYKMRLRLEFYNVDLYLYLQILRGEFDNILKWPFMHEVEFDFLNQETGLPQFSKTLKAVEYANKDIWKKPRKKENDGLRFYVVHQSYLSKNPAVSIGNQISFRVMTKINP